MTLQVDPDPTKVIFTLQMQGGNNGKAEVVVLNANGLL
jgi:hypothetical protein